MNVFIDGDKTGFNSKVAVDKFKAAVKLDVNISVEKLREKYINNSYTLELVEKNDTNIKFKLFKSEKSDKSDPEADKKQMLRMKLKSMRNSRTNTEIHKAKSNKDIPEDILEEYVKLKKVVNMPIPEPGEVLANPDQYRPMLSMVLGNDMMKQMGSNHPYTKYFRLLAAKLGVTEASPKPTQDYSELLKSTQKSEVVEIKGNDINMDNDTDSESN